MRDDLLRDLRDAIEGVAEAEHSGERRHEAVEHFEIGFEPAQPGTVRCVRPVRESSCGNCTVVSHTAAATVIIGNRAHPFLMEP